MFFLEVKNYSVFRTHKIRVKLLVLLLNEGVFTNQNADIQLLQVIHTNNDKANKTIAQYVSSNIVLWINLGRIGGLVQI